MSSKTRTLSEQSERRNARRRSARVRSAGLCPAVSQVFNLQGVRSGRRQGFGCPGAGGRCAGWKPAIQQVENLRYELRRYELGLPDYGRRSARVRSAGLCPAVSQVFNLQGVRSAARDRFVVGIGGGKHQGFGWLNGGGRSAGWKPAIQQVENLRYELPRYELPRYGLGDSLQALLQRQRSGTSQSRALTGLCTT